MMPYLIAHFKMSVIFAAPLLFLVKGKAISNRLGLVLSYLILIKSMVPWGMVDFSIWLFDQNIYTGGVSFDLPAGTAINASSDISSAFTLDQWIFFGWTTCFFLGLLYSLASFFRLATKVKQASPCMDPVVNDLTEGLLCKGSGLHPVTVVMSKVTDVPFVWWSRRWLIVVPESILSLRQTEQKVILAHELAHIKRYDFIKFFSLKVVKNLFFFSPFVHVVIKEILVREETQTDLTAMDLFNITPNTFGTTILSVLNGYRPVDYPAPTLKGITKRRLKMRIEGLFKKRQTRTTKWIQRGSTLAVFSLILLNFASAPAFDQQNMDADFIPPLASNKLTLGFGLKTHPLTKKPYRHQGIDLAAPMGADIVAPAKGNVLEAGYHDVRGHYLILQHGNGYTTLYSHLSEALTTKGAVVEKGETIAKVGNSGVSTGPHLHFEVHKDDTPVDPLAVIKILR